MASNLHQSAVMVPFTDIYHGYSTRRMAQRREGGRSIWYTALRSHNQTVLEEMKNWTALTWYVGMKTAFQTKRNI